MMMRNPLIAGERIYLRPLEAADAEAFAQGAADEPETQMGRGRLPSSPIAFARWIGETYLEPASQSPTHIPLAVCLCADDRCIGSTTIRRIDWINRTAETGTGLLTGFRDQGYGTEAKFLLMEYAFDQLHLHALSSHVWEPNERSAAVLRKQGYRLAGRLKWHDIKDGVYRDELIFDILRPDFIAAREAWRGR
jgi:RimJ/RimL family protein N-acetyltransferase